jgi:hypothetical protein
MRDAQADLNPNTSRDRPAAHQNAAVEFAIVTKRVVSHYEVDGYKRRGGREDEGGGLLTPMGHLIQT